MHYIDNKVIIARPGGTYLEGVKLAASRRVGIMRAYAFNPSSNHGHGGWFASIEDPNGYMETVYVDGAKICLYEVLTGAEPLDATWIGHDHLPD